MRTLAVLVVVLLLPAVLPAAEAQTTRTLDWEYHVSIPDPASGLVHVEMRFRNLNGIVDRITLLTIDRRDPITPPVGGPSTPLRSETGGISFAVDGDLETISFDVNVRRPAFKEGEYLTWVGDDFAIFKAESFALSFTYRYFEGKPFVWQGRVFLEPPEGWRSAAPWAPRGPNTFDLEPGQVLPRGYIVMGPFPSPEVHEINGKTVRYVELGGPAPFDDDDFISYLSDATPYFRGVYGEGTGKNLLVVKAKAPMFKGGLAAPDSIYVHETVDLRTLAHEYAHVFQQFGTDETQGISTMWFSEGDADLHSAISLLATERWSPKDVNDFFAEGERDANDATLRDARVVDATYGTYLEKFAYHKGTAILRALDKLIQDATGGGAGVGDLLRRINERHAPGSGQPTELVTNAELQAEAETITGTDLSTFFASHVFGTTWPEVAPFVPTGSLNLESLTLTPPSAAPGEAVLVRVNVSNTGTRPLSRILELLVDGDSKDAREVALPVGARTTVEMRFVAGDPGPHEVSVSYLRETFRSLLPPDIAVARASFVPSTVYAGESVRLLVFLENQGEQPGSATVEVITASGRLASTAAVFVDGSTTESVSIPIKFTRSGTIDLDIRAMTPTGMQTKTLSIDVRAADKDRDGVPDALDAYPDNPQLSDGSLVNDARDAIPQPGWLPLAVLVLVALGASRRRARL